MLLMIAVVVFLAPAIFLLLSFPYMIWKAGESERELRREEMHNLYLRMLKEANRGGVK